MCIAASCFAPLFYEWRFEYSVHVAVAFLLILKVVPIRLCQCSDLTRYECRLTFNKPKIAALAHGRTCSGRHRQHESVSRAPNHAPSWRCSLVGLDAHRADAFGASSWAQVGAVIAGLFAAVPCFVDSSPLARCLLMCFMGIPFIFAQQWSLSRLSAAFARGFGTYALGLARAELNVAPAVSTLRPFKHLLSPQRFLAPRWSLLRRRPTLGAGCSCDGLPAASQSLPSPKWRRQYSHLWEPP